MKSFPRGPLWLALCVVLADQAIKIYIKTAFYFGESREIFPWFHLHFTENPGMAFGMEWGGLEGKLALTIFRILAIGGILWWGRQQWLLHTHSQLTNPVPLASAKTPVLFYAIALILAGALGNVLDSVLYGQLFDRGLTYDASFESWLPYTGLALWGGNYAPPLLGNVVDMLYFPLWKGDLPSWIPFWGGDYFVFFRPIFNIADAAISCGVGLYIVSQWKRK